MKKRFLPALAALLFSVGVSAQNGAIIHFEAGKLDKAKEAIDKDIADPKGAAKPKVWFTRGQIYEAMATDQTGLYAKLDSMSSMTAYDSYKKAVELDTKEGKMGKIAKDAQDAILRNPTNKDPNKIRMYYGLLGQGNAKYQARNYTDALKLIRLASVVEPTDTTAAMFVGIAGQQGQNTAAAKEGYAKYLDLGGKDAVIFYALASIYKEEKDLDKAIATIDKGLAANPTNKDLQGEKVSILLNSGQAERAIESLKSLIEKDPSNATNILNLGILYDNAASVTADELRKYDTEDRKSGDADKKVTTADDNVKLYTEETARLSAALKKKPTDKELKRQLTEVQNKLATAQSELSAAKAEKTTADQAKAQHAAQNGPKLAELRSKFDEQKKNAREMYEKTLAVNPNSFEGNYNLGVFYYNEGAEIKRKSDMMDMATYNREGKGIEEQAGVKFKQALTLFNKAYSINKDDYALKNTLTQTLNVLKNIDKANAATYDAQLQKM